MTQESVSETGDGAIDRRRAIKRGIAAGAVAGVVWSAPKVEGLTLRPNYASAQSGPTETANFSIPAVNGVSSMFMSQPDICSGTGTVLVQTSQAFTGIPRNITIQFNPSGPNASGTPDQVTINPASALPGGIGNATPTANGYTFMGQLAADYTGPLTISVPYVCA